MRSNEADNNNKDKLELPHPIQQIPRTPQELQEMKENQGIEANVRAWLKNIVIGLNLCPFAERPMREQNLRLFTVRGSDEEDILSSILVCCCCRKVRQEQVLLFVPSVIPMISMPTWMWSI